MRNRIHCIDDLLPIQMDVVALTGEMTEFCLGQVRMCLEMCHHQIKLFRQLCFAQCAQSHPKKLTCSLRES